MAPANRVALAMWSETCIEWASSIGLTSEKIKEQTFGRKSPKALPEEKVGRKKGPGWGSKKNKNWILNEEWAAIQLRTP